MILFSPDDELISTVFQSAFQVLDGMADPVCVLDEHGRIIYANSALKQEMDRNPVGSFHDDPANELLGLSSVPTVRHTKQKVVKEERIGDKYYSVTTSPVMDDAGKINAFVEVYHDISSKINLTIDLVNTNKKMSDDIRFARTVQKKILPQHLDYGDLKFDALYWPSEKLSGDLYDIIPVDRTHVAFYMADVMGHGVTASMMTMFVRQTIRSACQSDPSPAAVLERIRMDFCQLGLGDASYFTVFYGLYNAKDRTLTYANAGHAAMPVLLRDGKATVLEQPGVPVSCVFLDVPYDEAVLPMQSKDGLLLYTDGLTETVNHSGEEYGIDRLTASFTDTSAEILVDIVKEVNRFRWGEMQDDIALMLMRME